MHSQCVATEMGKTVIKPQGHHYSKHNGHVPPAIAAIHYILFILVDEVMRQPELSNSLTYDANVHQMGLMG